ncbi:MAG: ferritin-like domain-containing protein [Acidobacteriota bacterium]
MTQAILHDLFVDQIRDIYDAEKQLTKALPKLAKAADSDELTTALRDHLGETEQQVARLEEVFGILGMTPKGKPCKGMKGLIEEGGESAEEEDKTLRDLGIIAGAQRVEHYEISAYGTARTLAEQLGLSDAAKLLQETEDEEKNADSTLTTIAMKLYGSSSLEGASDEDAGNGRMPNARAKNGTKNGTKTMASKSGARTR